MSETYIPALVERDEEHPPVARGVVCVDFDATLFPWGMLDADDPPFDGAVDALRAFKDAGYTIIIFTSRLSPTWHRAEGWDALASYAHWYKVCADRLDKWGIPWHDITAEKVPAVAYIDDKAIEFKNDWPEIQARVLSIKR